MIWWPLQALFVFAASTTLFDAIHFLLHKWARSRFKLLRLAASWHQVHHRFLDRGMQVHRNLIKANFWAHLVPEFVTTLMGTAIFLLVMPWQPVAFIAGVHCYFFVKHLYDEGIDVNHMAMKRVRGNRGVFRVDPSYHAMHHIQPTAFFSSFINVFDMIFGTALKLQGQRVTILGGTGSFGRAMAKRLMKAGAIVYIVGREGLSNYSWAHNTDILILALGTRKEAEAFSINLTEPVAAGEVFIDACRDRLVPAEIWGVGSEAEMFGGDIYALSKSAFADYAAKFWARNPNVTYRHIVPSSFRSKLGWGPMSANTVAAVSLFLIRRGFVYIPVTLTGVAFLNRILFGLRKHHGGKHVQSGA